MERDKRRYKRYSTDSIKVNGRIMLSKIVDIIDISLGGIALKADRRLNIGNEYILKIEEKDLQFSAKATVVWASLHESRRSGNGDMVPIYAAGMKFNAGQNDKISELIKFIASPGQARQVADATRLAKDLRFHMRLRINHKGKAVLDCPEEYAIRTISMGGMLIETENVLAVEDKIPMEISLPENNTINFLARVVSCTPVKEKRPEAYAIGIEFLNMPPDHKELLEGFVSMLA
jgi:Tfp pilus assembly protein PilZ